MALAGTSVKMETSLGAANVTAGDASYKSEVAAASGQVVKVQLSYKNTEKPTDDNKAKNTRVKITLPANVGTGQTVTASLKADNSDQNTSQATVKIDQENGRLQYIPGSAVWKHNTGSREKPTVAETRLNDEVVLGAQGFVLEDTQAGDEYTATVTILARVSAPGLTVTTESQAKGDLDKWSDNNTAQPGATMRHIVNYQNTSGTEQKQVIVRDALPAKAKLVPGTTKLVNASNPNGVAVGDTISASGINIGNYGPGANAYVTFEATIPAAEELACGGNEMRNIGVVQPSGMSEYYASSITTVNRDCKQQTPAPAPTPTYSCDLLTLAKGGNRKVTSKVDYKAENGAKLKMVTYDFGDGSQPLVTDKTTADYTYKKDGKFTVTAKLTVTANNKDETVTSASCAQSVDFTTPAAPAVASAATTGGNLPNTGAGDVFGIFAGATLIGFLAHRMFTNRRLTQRP
jgi:uncharacterized repeat protein (TIGR01451 family)